MRNRFVFLPLVLVVLFFQLGCISVKSESKSLLPDASTLLNSANVSTFYWKADVTDAGVVGDEHHWIVGTFQMPSFGDDEICEANGKLINIVTRGSAFNKASIFREEDAKLINVPPESFSKPQCADLSLKSYFSISPSLSADFVKNLLKKLKATADCYPHGDGVCKTWSEISVPPAFRKYFEELPSLSPLSVYIQEDSSIEVTFRYSDSVPVYLKCFISSDKNGAEKLEVGAGPVGG